MEFLQLIVFCLGITYGGLTIIPCVLQLKKKQVNLWANIMMAVGAALVIVAIDMGYLVDRETTWVLILGLLFIHIAAINNGFKLYGRINIKHHIIRFIISLALVILYVIAF